MTAENWPLIGRAGDQDNGLIINCAPSGFGTMTACAAGELCAAWVAGGNRICQSSIAQWIPRQRTYAFSAIHG